MLKPPRSRRVSEIIQDMKDSARPVVPSNLDIETPKEWERQMNPSELEYQIA